MLAPKDYIRSEFKQLDVHELAGRPVSTLQGVTKVVEEALHGIGISTVFDLGASWVFANARAAAGAATEGTVSSRFGMAPTDWLHGDHAGTALDQIGALPVEALRGMSHAHATALAAALDVHNIRDFAYWPPQVAAQKLVGELAGGSLGDVELQDTEALRPKFGDFPTERVYYRTLAMLEMAPQGRPGDIVRSPLSLIAAMEHEKSPGAPAIGAMLTYSQSWYAKGITLGHMLHSLALAPGEATRVAVVDWSRRSKASDVEAVGEQEGLDNSMDHARAISEVQNAVANEMEQGGSHTHAHSRSESSSTQAAAGTGLLTSLEFSGDISHASQEASTTTDASSSSWSQGNRSVLGTMNQNVNDRTEQHATSVRNRRASAVSEVGDTGHEQVSTRIVANYNHMHALTVQYYETVQVYRVLTQLHDAERCLFVPIEMLDFAGAHGMELVEHFRGALIRASLNRRARELLLDQTTAVAVTPAAPIQMPTLRPRLPVHRVAAPVHATAAKLPTNIFGALTAALHAAQAHPHVERTSMNALQTALNTITGHHAAGHPVSFSPFETALHAAQAHPHAEKTGLAAITSAFGAAKTIFGTPAAHPTAPVVARSVFHPVDIAHIAQIVGRAIVRPASHSLYFPQDTEVHGLSFEGVHVRSVTVTRVGGGTSAFPVVDQGSEVDFHPAPRLSEIAAISVIKADNPAVAGKMTMQLGHLGRYFASPPIDVSFGTGTAAHQVLTFKSEAEDRKRELLAHLQANRTHYSQAVFKSLDPATIVTMLAQYSWNGRPLADQVEPRPIAVKGNYLVLRAPVELEEHAGTHDGHTWGQLLHSRGIDFTHGDHRLIPIPTSGVYAEAVLGRSNSAEKLDITRFWHWQDSPIPLPPPEISPVSTKMPETTLRAKPGALEAPVVGIMAPTALPDPTSLNAALTAVSKGDLFRDMSGLAGTQALAKEAEAQTLKGTTEAAKLASANMATEAQKAVEMGKIAADLIKSAVGAKMGADASKDSSTKGAELNHAVDQDKRGIPGPDSAGSKGGDKSGDGAGKGSDGAGKGTGAGGGGKGTGTGGAAGGANANANEIAKVRANTLGFSGADVIPASFTTGTTVDVVSGATPSTGSGGSTPTGGTGTTPPDSLTAPLTDREWKMLDTWLTNGVVGVDKLTADPVTNGSIVASAIFCSRAGSMLIASNTEDPLLCIDPAVTAADPRVQALIPEVERRSGPIVYWNAVPPDVRAVAVMNRLIAYGYSEQGAAALVGNQIVESRVLPNRIEGSAEATPMRAPNWAGKITDFTADEIMNRSKAKQVGPGEHNPGIGIVQWTTAGRRGGLFQRTDLMGRPLGSSVLFDMGAQIAYVVDELQQPEPSLQNLNRDLRDPTKTDHDLDNLTNHVMSNYEIPSAGSEAARRAAAHHALAVYRAGAAAP